MFHFMTRKVLKMLFFTSGGQTLENCKVSHRDTEWLKIAICHMSCSNAWKLQSFTSWQGMLQKPNSSHLVDKRLILCHQKRNFSQCSNACTLQRFTLCHQNRNFPHVVVKRLKSAMFDSVPNKIQYFTFGGQTLWKVQNFTSGHRKYQKRFFFTSGGQTLENCRVSFYAIKNLIFHLSWSNAWKLQSFPSSHGMYHQNNF